MSDPPARPAHGKTGSARSSKNDSGLNYFFVPLKMALFPYGFFDASPARSPDPCPIRLPDPPTAKLEVRDGLKICFALFVF